MQKERKFSLTSKGLIQGSLSPIISHHILVNNSILLHQCLNKCHHMDTMELYPHFHRVMINTDQQSVWLINRKYGHRHQNSKILQSIPLLLRKKKLKNQESEELKSIMPKNRLFHLLLFQRLLLQSILLLQW